MYAYGTHQSPYSAPPSPLPLPPSGTFPLHGSRVFNIRALKKAPRLDLCFCIKPAASPLWPGDTKEVSPLPPLLCFMSE